MYNIMIVDDEPLIKKGLICFVNWELLNCKVVCEAGNGIEAIQFLKSNAVDTVDIVITDIKMPGINGLELSKYICENYPNIKVIILTAFADFSYAQTAINYNVVDFIIKTKPVEKIPDAVNKAKALIIKEKENEAQKKLLEHTFHVNMTELKEKFFKDILNGVMVSPEEAEKKAKELEIDLEHYFIVVYEIDSAQEQNSSNYPSSYLLDVRHFLDHVWRDYRHYTLIMNPYLLSSIVSFNGSGLDSHQYAHTLKSVCDEMLAMLKPFMSIPLSIGISGLHRNATEMIKAYRESIKALANHTYDTTISIYTDNSNPTKREPFIQNDKFHEKIVDHIREGSQDAAISWLRELFDTYKKESESIEQIKTSSIVLCSLCFRLLISKNLNDSQSVVHESEIYQKIQWSNSIDHLFTILSQVITSLTSLMNEDEKRYGKIVTEVNHFLKDHYDQDINLQKIAGTVHVNSSYLSRLYKHETGISIVDTINKLRIEKAKLLLKNPAAKIFEVASAVGINDPSYFTHVFFKYTGLSPKEYKTRN